MFKNQRKIILKMTYIGCLRRRAATAPASGSRHGVNPVIYNLARKPEPQAAFMTVFSTLGRESDPNQTTPGADAFVFGDEVARWFSLELQPRHHSL
jgi:hypothetical protein